MPLDLSQLTIPPASAVPEPTAEDWERFIAHWKIRLAWYERDAQDQNTLAGSTRVETWLLRHCRELESEVARLRADNERLRDTMADEFGRRYS